MQAFCVVEDKNAGKLSANYVYVRLIGMSFV